MGILLFLSWIGVAENGAGPLRLPADPDDMRILARQSKFG
jgi:hypothetical protein